MPDTYSVDEAKAQLTTIIARVRQGETVAIAEQGVPVAEIHPARPSGERPPAPEAAAEVDPLAARLAELEARGVLQRAASGPRSLFPAIATVPGALQRFLDDRNE